MLKAILRFVAAALSAAGLVGLKAALEAFQGSFSGGPPPDISVGVFMVLATGVIALVGYLLSKFGPKV